jgi:hypothetical protein
MLQKAVSEASNIHGIILVLVVIMLANEASFSR